MAICRIQNGRHQTQNGCLERPTNHSALMRSAQSAVAPRSFVDHSTSLLLNLGSNCSCVPIDWGPILYDPGLMQTWNATLMWCVFFVFESLYLKLSSNRISENIFCFQCGLFITISHLCLSLSVFSWCLTWNFLQFIYANYLVHAHFQCAMVKSKFFAHTRLWISALALRQIFWYNISKTGMWD